MAHTYKAEYSGDVPVLDEIVRFFEEFYRISDIPGEHDQYVDLYTQDATFILASKKAHGCEEITAMRHGMWTAVASRKHTIVKVFPYARYSDEFMLYGSVELGLRNGVDVNVDWAARASVTKSAEDGKWRMKHYQVYMDTGAVAAANKS